MTFEDVTGRTIDIGDVILYTMSTAGSAPAMRAGEVTKFNKASIVVKEVDPTTFRPITDADYNMEPDGPPILQYAGKPYERMYQPTKVVYTGTETERQPQLIPKPEAYRFYIIKKI